MTRTTAGIRTEQVRFRSAGTELRGTLQLPGGRSGPLPAVVVTGTWTSVKEQMADRYAAALAQRGFAALSFDFAGFGESGGDPRDVEDPSAKVGDISAAVGFLTAHPEIDADLVTAVYGGADGVASRIAAGQQARADDERTGEVADVPAVSGTDPDAAMPFEIDFYLDPARGGIPAWPNRFAVMSWPLWLRFDPIAAAPDVSQPVLVVHSDDGAIPDGARRFLARLPRPAHAIWTDGTQFDFYDDPAHVELAADAAAAHFAGNG